MSTPLTDRINLLTSQANAKTGASDTTLSDAIETLIVGYGGGGSSVKSGTITFDANKWNFTLETGLPGLKRIIIAPHVLPYEVAYARCMGAWFVDFERKYMVVSFGPSSANATPTQSTTYDLNSSSVATVDSAGTITFSGLLNSKCGILQADTQYDWHAFA